MRSTRFHHASVDSNAQAFGASRMWLCVERGNDPPEESR
jgi:hypothetical protein